MRHSSYLERHGEKPWSTQDSRGRGILVKSASRDMTILLNAENEKEGEKEQLETV